MPLHYHILYGFRVASDIPLLNTDSAPSPKNDVSIYRASKPVPEDILATPAIPIYEPWLYYHHFEGEWWAEYRDVLWMRVTMDTIEYYPLNVPGEEDIKTYILGTGLSLCLQLRGYFPLHGSMVQRDGKGLLFTGHRGAGKSTTAAYFVQQGGKLITDDVALIHLMDKKAEAIPAFPLLKLWNDALEKLGVKDADLELAMEGLDKKKLPVKDAFTDQPVNLDTIIELHPSEEPDIRIEKCIGMTAFEVIAANIYRSKAVEALGKQKEHFEFCSMLAGRVRIFKLYRPQDRWSVDDIFNVISDMA